jgi:hypothetical protein
MPSPDLANIAPRADGAKIAVEEERARTAAILDSEEAQGRTKLARHFAFKTGVSAKDALAALAAAPAETPASTETPLTRAMRTYRQPRLGPGGDPPMGATIKAPDAASIYARRAEAGRRS